jgi:hypothetical protein
MSAPDGELAFTFLATCQNPMEAELFPAVLREKEIPHRAAREPDGRIRLEVPQEWLPEARASLQEAARIFFGPEPAGRPALPGVAQDAPEPEEPAEEDLPPLEDLPTAEETRLRPVWPAWALAALPGLGLGHLYAGHARPAFYLLLCSALGVFLLVRTGSLWTLGLVAYAWGWDLFFAARHVRDRNQRAERARRILAEREREFLAAVEAQPPRAQENTTS